MIIRTTINAVLEEPVEKWIFRMAVPTTISMLVTTFYNMADTYFVGRLNDTSATGAVGVVYSWMLLQQAVGYFFAHGSGNFISRQLGAGKTAEAETMASVGFFCALFFGIFSMIFGLLFLEPLTYLLGATETIFPYARDYLAVILAGAPFVCGSYVLNSQLRFQGSATFSMIGIASGAVINCLLDPLLILIGGLGIRGAAIATAISQLISFLLLLAGSFRGQNIRIRISRFHPSWYYIKATVNGGLPSLCRMGISSISGILLNLAAGNFGDYAITALSICSRLLMFFNSIMMGFGQGYQPVCGMNYGARLYKRVLHAFWFCVRVSFWFLLVISAVGIVFARQIVQLFSQDPQVVAFGAGTFRFMCMALPLNSWSVLANMTLQTIGKSARASFLACSRHGYSYIPPIFILPLFLGDFGLQLVHFCSDILTALISIPLLLPVLREMADAEPD